MIARAIQAKLKSTDAYDLAGATANLTQTDARALLERVPLGNPPGTADWPRAASFDVHPDYVLVTRHSPNVERDSSQRKSFVTDVVRATHSAMEDLRWNPFVLLQTPNHAPFEEFRELPELRLNTLSEEQERERRASLADKADQDRLTETLAAAIHESSSLWLDAGDLETELELAFLLIPISLRRFLTFNTRLYVRPERLPRIAVTDPDRVAVAELNWGFKGRRENSHIAPDAVVAAGEIVALLSDEDLLAEAQRFFDSVPASEANWQLSEGTRSFLDLTELLVCLRGDDIKGALAKLGTLDERLADAASARFISLEPVRLATVVADSVGSDLKKSMKRLMSFMIRSPRLEPEWYREFRGCLNLHERRPELEADYGRHFFLGALAVGDRKGFLGMFEDSWLREIADDPLRDHASSQGPDELGSLLDAGCVASIGADLQSVEALLEAAVVLDDSDPPIARATIKRLVRVGFEGVPEGRLLDSLPKLVNAWRLIEAMYRGSTTKPELVRYARKLLSDSDPETRTSMMATAARDELRSCAEAVGWGAWVLVSASEKRVRSESPAVAVSEILGNVYPAEFGSSVSALVDLHPPVLDLPGWSRVKDLVPLSEQSRLASLVLLRALSAGVPGEGDFSHALEACVSAVVHGARFKENDEVLPRVIEAVGSLANSSNSVAEEAVRLELLSYALTMLCADDSAVTRLRNGLAEKWGRPAKFAELASVDRARSVLDGLRDHQEIRDRVLETARDSDLPDRALSERIERLLGPGLLDRVMTQLFRESEHG